MLQTAGTTVRSGRKLFNRLRSISSFSSLPLEAAWSDTLTVTDSFYRSWVYPSSSSSRFSSRCSVTATIHSFWLAPLLPTKTLVIYSTVAHLGYALSSYCTATVADVNTLGPYVMFCTASWVFLGFTLVRRPPSSPVVTLRVLGSSYNIHFICWCLRQGFSC